MNIDSLARAASTGSVIGVKMLRDGLDQKQGQMAQLLQALPPPMAGVGTCVDCKA